MTLNKKLLASAVGLAVLSAASAASAQVFIGEEGSRVYARELVKPVNLNDANDDIGFELGYNFSPSEVRYGRLECSNVEFNSTATLAVSGTNSNEIELGAINGINSSALFFSITGASTITPSTPTSEVQILADSTLRLLNNDDVACSFSIYDQPSQAQAGGTAGRIFTTGSDVVISTASVFSFTTSPGRATADVESTPQPFLFFLGSDEDEVIGEVDFGLSDDTVLDNNGVVITSLATVFNFATSRLVVTPAVTLPSSHRLRNGFDSNDVFSNVAAPNIALSALGSTGVFADIEYVVPDNNNQAIPANTFQVSIAAQRANAAWVVPATIGPQPLGVINRNGTELQAPLAQIPAGWLSRIVLTNSGTQQRDYRLTLTPATGGSASEASSTFTGPVSQTGTIAAGGTVVVSVSDLFPAANFTGPLRGTIRATVDGPSSEVEGLYQIVNPASGSISNHVLARPAQNELLD